MEYRRLGRTGLPISALSFGSWVTFHKQIDDSRSTELMKLAYDSGIEARPEHLQLIPLVPVHSAQEFNPTTLEEERAAEREVEIIRVVVLALANTPFAATPPMAEPVPSLSDQMAPMFSAAGP